MDTTANLEQQIKTVFTNFITPLRSLSDQLINAEPKHGSWTIGQLAQHVAFATAGVPDEKTKPANRPADQLETSIKETFLNEKEKFKSPEAIAPQKKEYGLPSILKQLKDNEETLLILLKEKDLHGLCLGMELPGWGYLTRYEWIKLIVYHVQRHTVQLQKLIAH